MTGFQEPHVGKEDKPKQKAEEQPEKRTERAECQEVNGQEGFEKEGLMLNAA